jgi:hypothetical protein
MPQVLVTKMTAQANEVKKGQITNRQPMPSPAKASMTAIRFVSSGFTIRLLLLSITTTTVKHPVTRKKEPLYRGSYAQSGGDEILLSICADLDTGRPPRNPM